MWCIPPEQDAAFVSQMEQVLEVYKRPYNPRHPQVCMDEQPKQLIAEKQTPQPVQPGTPTQIDHEYIRQGVCTVWMFVEPLAGWRDVQVSERRIAGEPLSSAIPACSKYSHDLATFTEEPLYLRCDFEKFAKL